MTYLKFDKSGFLIEKDSETSPRFPYFKDKETLKSSLELLKEHIKKHERFFVNESIYSHSYYVLNYIINDKIYIHLGFSKYVVSLEEYDDYITPERDINYVHSLIDTFYSYL